MMSGLKSSPPMKLYFPPVIERKFGIQTLCKRHQDSETVFTWEQSAHILWMIWIIIWIAHFELSFEWRYFGPCVHQTTSRCVIWNAQFKWRSGGVVQVRISQIMQRNRRMNALTSKLWFGGRSYVRDLLTTSAYIPHAAYMYVQMHRKCELRACLIGRVPRHSSPAPEC